MSATMGRCECRADFCHVGDDEDQCTRDAVRLVTVPWDLARDFGPDSAANTQRLLTDKKVPMCEPCASHTERTLGET